MQKIDIAIAARKLYTDFGPKREAAKVALEMGNLKPANQKKVFATYEMHIAWWNKDTKEGV